MATILKIYFALLLTERPIYSDEQNRAILVPFSDVHNYVNSNFSVISDNWSESIYNHAMRGKKEKMKPMN